MKKSTALQKGFTLLEILVALAILSIVCLALITTGGVAADNAGYLRERTLATWVAMNKAAELELAGKWVPVSSGDGESEMAGRKWNWKVTGHETPDADLRRAVIEVRRESGGDEPLAVFTIFLGRPAKS
jgi:general secretion pathway protein I